MRTQDCREAIDWILEHCPIQDDTRRDLENARDLCRIHPEISGLSTHAIQPLIHEPDEEIKENAISSISKSLESGKDPLTGKFKTGGKVTEKEVREVIQKEKEKKTSISTFNVTNDNIEWAKFSWNPVTGCKHDCPYCYARDIANRFYEEKFEPTFKPNRLSAPQNTKPIPGQNKNVFVCSMADLFGEWVPEDWINQVLKACKDSPEWNYLFLTKNPTRLAKFEFPINAWVGTTVDRQARVNRACNSFKEVQATVKFLSCEPLLEPLDFSEMNMFDWIIIGGNSGNSQTPASQPEWEWVEDLVNQARMFDLKVYFKPNLTVRPKEYPKVK